MIGWSLVSLHADDHREGIRTSVCSVVRRFERGGATVLNERITGTRALTSEVKLVCMPAGSKRTYSANHILV